MVLKQADSEKVRKRIGVATTIQTILHSQALDLGEMLQAGEGGAELLFAGRLKSLF
jgi:hypothetical protein